MAKEKVTIKEEVLIDLLQHRFGALREGLKNLEIIITDNDGNEIGRFRPDSDD